MLKKRLIPALVIRDGTVVQSIQFRHTNVIHWKPLTAVDFFNKWAVDEIVVFDVSRKLTSRAQFHQLLLGLSKKCFVPLTVGGWVTSVAEMRRLLRLGADKVTINTAAVQRPELIKQCAEAFGSQCVVVSIDVRMNARGEREVYVDRGSVPTGLSPVEWAREAEAAGAGELFVTSIDHEGMRKGYDLELIRSVVDAVDVPVVAFGGVFTWQHLVDGVVIGGAEGVSAANVFHFTEHSTRKAKDYMRKAGLDVR